MNEHGSGSILGALLFWAVIGGGGYAAYNHFHGLKVHSKTVIAAKVKNFGIQRVYNENGELESNQVNAALNIPMGPVVVGRKLSVEETNPTEAIPFTNRDRLQLNQSTTVSTNSEPLRYGRKYDQNGILVGQTFETDLFGYGREYRRDGTLKHETLSAGVNLTVGPVDLQCRRIWTFTKPARKNYPSPLFDNWKQRFVIPGVPPKGRSDLGRDLQSSSAYWRLHPRTLNKISQLKIVQRP